MSRYFSIKMISKIILFSIAIIILNMILFKTYSAISDMSGIFEGFEEKRQSIDKDAFDDNDFSYDFKESFFANRGTSYAVLEASTLRVLGGENIDKKMEMASTTKIMTALIVLENSNLDKEFKIPKEAVGIEGSSIYLKENQIWTIRDLLYGLMLRSGNDSAMALAIATAGSCDRFVEMMNEKAEELNLKNTHFENPHGLHSDTHYTSAYDLAVISSYAMRNDEFVKIVSSKSYVAEANQTRERQYFLNKNKLLSSYDGANGIKTGYTTDSGRCLVSSALKNNMQVVCVVLNCYDMWNACSHYMDKAFDEYQPVEMGKKGDILATLDINDKEYSLALQSNFVLPLREGDNIECGGFFDIDESLEVPVEKGSVVGKINFYNDNRLLFGVNIVNIEEINDTGVLRKLKNLTGNWNASFIDGEIKQIFGINGGSIQKRCG